MTYYPITAAQARAFIRQHISNPRIPAGHKWYMVCGFQYYPRNRRNVYLIAGDSGLTGVVGFSRRAA